MKYFKYLLTYRWTVGMIAWILMRITGIMLFIFLVIHLTVFFLFGKSQAAFSHFLVLRERTIIKFLEPLLIFTVCYHALNGCKIIFMD
ncbi:MAG TPA: succinate dehydrogenase, cytochrome b556 subunit, partial [Candidatus Desulfofervidus auxilii]|nr:succinate dehydrogenase, cytochrome b556 subunit [Candidatus Desulfofervidus auxilii]